MDLSILMIISCFFFFIYFVLSANIGRERLISIIVASFVWSTFMDLFLNNKKQNRNQRFIWWKDNQDFLSLVNCGWCHGQNWIILWRSFKRKYLVDSCLLTWEIKCTPYDVRSLCFILIKNLLLGELLFSFVFDRSICLKLW